VPQYNAKEEYCLVRKLVTIKIITVHMYNEIIISKTNERYSETKLKTSTIIMTGREYKMNINIFAGSLLFLTAITRIIEVISKNSAKKRNERECSLFIDKKESKLKTNGVKKAAPKCFARGISYFIESEDKYMYDENKTIINK